MKRFPMNNLCRWALVRREEREGEVYGTYQCVNPNHDNCKKEEREPNEYEMRLREDDILLYRVLTGIVVVIFGVFLVVMFAEAMM